MDIGKVLPVRAVFLTNLIWVALYVLNVLKKNIQIFLLSFPNNQIDGLVEDCSNSIADTGDTAALY